MECHLCFYTEVDVFRVMETTLYLNAPISLKPIQGVPFTVILKDVQLLNNSFRNYDFSIFFQLPLIHTLVVDGLLVQGNSKSPRSLFLSLRIKRTPDKIAGPAGAGGKQSSVGTTRTAAQK